jgi:hypothetical protein
MAHRGDECTDCYYWCAGCGVYTLRLYRDVFTGPGEAHDSEPLDKDADRGFPGPGSFGGCCE